MLINPRLELSFWGLEHALPFTGKRAALPVAALPPLANRERVQHILKMCTAIGIAPGQPRT